MSSRHLIAIAFSDLHLNLWPTFNKDLSRTKNGLRVISKVQQLCDKYHVPGLFCGDFFHKPEYIDNELLSILAKKYSKLKKPVMPIYGISGNHDMNHVNGFETHASSLWDSLCRLFPNSFKNVDYDRVEEEGLNIYGVPYIDHNIGLDKYLKEADLLDNGKPNILLLHTDYPGAKDTNGIEVGTSENINMNLLNRFNLILMGHIHKPQRLSKKVYMIGAPLQQRRTDRDCDMGIWMIFSDLTLKFKPLDFPKFIDVTKEEDIVDDGNYYTLVSPKVASIDNLEDRHVVDTSLSQRKLVKRYFKYQGIVDKTKKKVVLDILKEASDD